METIRHDQPAPAGPMTIRPFSPADQAQARALINAGLGEHFGFVDERFNPDLDDIAQTYASGCFLLGEIDGALVATGAYRPLDGASVLIVRMSVRADLRRRGLATRMLNALLSHARQAGYVAARLETTSTWHEVITFYLRNGFRITGEQAGETWFEKPL